MEAIAKNESSTPSPKRWRRWAIRAILVVGAIALLLDILTLGWTFSAGRFCRDRIGTESSTVSLTHGQLVWYYDSIGFGLDAQGPKVGLGSHTVFEPRASAKLRFESLTEAYWVSGKLGDSAVYQHYTFSGFAIYRYEPWSPDSSPDELKGGTHILFYSLPLYALWLPAIIIVAWRWRKQRRNRVAVGFPVQQA